MKLVKLLTPGIGSISNPTYEQLKKLFVQEGDDAWDKINGDAMTSFKESSEDEEHCLFIHLVPPRRFCVDFHGTAISADLSDKARVKMYDGQEYVSIQRSRLVPPEVALAAAHEFCQSGRRLKGFPWVDLNILRDPAKEAVLNDDDYDVDCNTDWD